MRCRRTSLRSRFASVGKDRRGFTLAETLAALAFVAVVIPVAVHGVRIANLAAQVAERRLVAMRVADRVLNEIIATGRWNTAGSGSVQEGRHTFAWRSQSVSWQRATLRELTVSVTFNVQGVERVARASTVVDSAQP